MNNASRMSDRRVQTACLLIMALISIGVTLWLLQPVLVPFVLALFFSQCLAPLIKILIEKCRLPQMIAVAVTVLLTGAVLTVVGFILASSISGVSSLNNLSQQDWTNKFHGWEESRLARRIGIQPGANIDAYVNFFKDKALGWASYIFDSVTTILKNGASVLLLMAFMLFGRRPGRRQPGGIISEIESRVQQYISLTVLMSAVTGLLVGLALAILNVKFAAGFGFLAFLLNFIPNVGAVIATVLPIPVIFLDPSLQGHLVTQLLAIAIPAGMQVLLGSLQPRVLGNSLDLHPVVVLLSLLFFSMIWGVGGAFLATPLTAVIKIVFERIPATRPLAAALAGNLEPLTETIDPPVEDVMVMQERKVSSSQLEAGL